MWYRFPASLESNNCLPLWWDGLDENIKERATITPFDMPLAMFIYCGVCLESVTIISIGLVPIDNKAFGNRRGSPKMKEPVYTEHSEFLRFSRQRG